MSILSSLFERRIRALIWASFALLALLPVLSMTRIWLVARDPEVSQFLRGIEICTLAAFIVCCLIAGLTVLLSIANRLRDLTEKTAGLGRHPAADGEASAPATGGSEARNELASLTDSLSRVQVDFLKNLQQLQQQATFLDNLQHVLNHTSDMVMMLNERNSISFSNQTAREKLGILPDTSVRHSLAEGLLRKTDAERLSGLLENWQDIDEILEFARADGSRLYVHCIQTVVNLQNQDRSKIIILRDMTERKQMENQLFRSEQLAALGQLISGVAHELNNPLAAVLGFAELCRDERIRRDDLNRNLEIIEREARRTAHIVENLLNFSRQRDTRRVPVNIHDLLERCFTLLAYNFRTNNITVRRNYMTSMPLLELDEFQVQQVFMNLIINAAQAMHDAGTPCPCITVETTATADRKGVRISIGDNGPGIPAELLARVFEPFFTTKQESHGTGLGLTVSRGIIRSHNGDVVVSSRAGAGATFTIQLPLPESLTLPETAVSGTPAKGKMRGRVLAVDDEPSILAMTSQVLSRQGIEVVTSTTVAESLILLQQQEFDVIVTDIRMPDGNGTQLRDFLQIFRPESRCRVLYVTGDPNVTSGMKKRLGDVPVLIKPFHVQELVNAVTQLLESAKAPVGSKA